MVTVTTYAELREAVLRDETCIHLESYAKQYYERKTADMIGGGVIGALPGLLVAGPIGAAIGAFAGAAIGNAAKNNEASEQDIIRFLIRYYRKSSSGVNFIELTHR